MSCQSSQALTSAAAHAQQESVAERLAQDPRDATDVRHGVHEEHELHLLGGRLVVLAERLLHRALGLAGDSGKHTQTVSSVRQAR